MRSCVCTLSLREESTSGCLHSHYLFRTVSPLVSLSAVDQEAASVSQCCLVSPSVPRPAPTEEGAQDYDLPIEAVHEAAAYVRDHQEREQILDCNIQYQQTPDLRRDRAASQVDSRRFPTFPVVFWRFPAALVVLKVQHGSNKKKAARLAHRTAPISIVTSHLILRNSTWSCQEVAL